MVFFFGFFFFPKLCWGNVIDMLIFFFVCAIFFFVCGQACYSAGQVRRTA